MRPIIGLFLLGFAGDLLGSVLSGRVVETRVSKDGVGWTMALPGTHTGDDLKGQFPVSKLTVRACSLDRVLETQNNLDGSFRFTGVPPGIYEVVAGGAYWGPAAITGVSVLNTDVGPITIDMSLRATEAHCFMDESQRCSVTRVSVNYDPPVDQESGTVHGTVNRARKHAQESGLPKARIALTRAGAKQPLQTTYADHHGRFEFHVPPGTYELDISRSGFQPVISRPFLVPKDNTTRVTVSTAPAGWVVICE